MTPAFELYAVTGRPVAHSLSPGIFVRFFAALGLEAAYTRLAADSARRALDMARTIGMKGLNVTSPFKEEVIPHLEALEGSAARIGAVNCLTFGQPALRSGPAIEAVGWNTDHIGLVKALAARHMPVSGRKALVLGTGGAARAAAYGLARAGAREVTIAGRSSDKARAVAGRLRCDGTSLLEALKRIREFDLCVSCLPFPAARVLQASDTEGMPILDAHYAGAVAASERNPPALAWLLHQAVPSFEIFTGLKVPKDVAREAGKDLLKRETLQKPDIALVGFMGVGKTAVGRVLADLLDREFFDTDELIEASSGMGAAEIFRTRGEGAFRALERSAVERLAGSSGRSPKVISVGGGAVLDEGNRKTLSRTCRVIWLWAEAPTALSRIDPATRPVLDPGRPLESARRTLAGRVPLYASVSDLIIDAASGSPVDVAGRIKDELDQALED